MTSKESTDFVSFNESELAGVLDVELAVSNLGGSWAVYRDVAAVFLTQMDELKGQLEGLCDSPQSLQAAVHEIGSSLGIVGAMQAHEAARSIENRLRRGEGVDLDALRALRVDIEHAIGAVRAKMA